jgi:hypothetical protein
MALPAGLSPATRRFEAARSDILSYGSLELEPTRRLALPRGINARQFTKLLLSLLSHAGVKWWVATVLPRALRFKRPLHRLQCLQPSRDTKAELNRRGQACDFLTGTGISRRLNGQSGG